MADTNEPADAPDRMERRSRAYRTAINIERVGLCAVLVAMFGLLILQVITRYLFNTPLSWTEETARFLLVWLTFLGAGYLMSRRLHISVDLLVARMGRQAMVAVDILATLVALVTSVVMATAGAALAHTTGNILTPATEVPMWLVHAAAVAGFTLIALHSLANIVVSMRHPEDVPGTAAQEGA
ncbi:TRAP transporter small permease [Nocardiopsis salina]|uniref:TRAP transporter small permease n=1 Tax=Nocardiopsis salina TaxID=245836 RepID=UPI000349E7D8|nr:TRAP transporter small permease [Nocardiopsis salina]